MSPNFPRWTLSHRAGRPSARLGYSVVSVLGAVVVAGLLTACSSGGQPGSASANAAAQTSGATSQVSPQIVHELAPSGTLRAAINYGNPILATRDASTGELHGISVDLSRELARELGVPVQFVPYPAARKVVEGAPKGEWDVAFVGIDAKRAEDMLYTAPYVIIEGVYMVRTNSPYRSNNDIDQAGVRVAVSGGSAYDLFLSRELHNATLVRVPDPSIVTATMLKQSLDVVAGVKQRNEADAVRFGGLRLLPGDFMVIRQAMATPNGRPEGVQFLRAFIERMKATGFVAKSLQDNGINGAGVAPPAAAS